ncbi:MAG TPA: hypothetical protein VHN81_06675 [Edaphobacter sp.]|nr:hypothetical protein [Edaphobacter sp.]
MRHRAIALVVAMLMLASNLLLAKDKSKDKDTLPPWLLQGHTASVIIDPDSGVSMEDPNANQIARRDVQAALQKWGRYEPSLVNQPSDLIIVIRRGHRRMADATESDPRQNGPIGAISPTDDGISAAGRRGNPTTTSPQDMPGRPSSPGSSPQLEVGSTDDSFAVYDGHSDRPLDSPPAWRYVAPDALRSPSVPAVAQFRKAVAAADKAANKP